MFFFFSCLCEYKEIPCIYGKNIQSAMGIKSEISQKLIIDEIISLNETLKQIKDFTNAFSKVKIVYFSKLCS